MLEADEVDIDYFTPVASTTLANIFGSDTHIEEKDDVSLKYVPIPPQNTVPKKEESKATQIVYASAFFGYEWVNSTYLSRGKLGAAIVKSVKTELYNIILYDSNKLTLSCTNISPQLEVNIKGNSNLSYYDSCQNYWSLYGTDAEISKFIEKLKPFNIQINNLPGPENISTKKHDDNIISSQILKDEENDTDYSIKRRTKDSILKRMATMGQSVLPKQAVTLPRSDESSDTDATSQKVVRHKLQKINFKRNLNEKVDLHKDSSTEVNLEKGASKLHSDNISASNFDQQLVPIKSTNIITDPIINNSNDLSLFMSEQRISNSELRININRLTDKMDKIIQGIHGIGESESNSNTINFQSNIVQKLLNEYENKIKTYENYLISKGLDYATIFKSCRQHGEDNMQNDIDSHKNKIEKLEKIMEEKDRENALLRNELKSLQAKFESYYKENDKKQEEQFKEINLLKQELCSKNEELATLSEDLKSLSLQKSSDFRRKIKSIMNKTFHSLSANFDDSESYPGAAIKSLFASVIKKETMEALNEV